MRMTKTAHNKERYIIIFHMVNSGFEKSEFVIDLIKSYMLYYYLSRKKEIHSQSATQTLKTIEIDTCQLVDFVVN